MKLKLLLCGAALVVAGCASEQNPFAGSGEFSYTYDLVPQPVPGLTQAELARIAEVPVTATPLVIPDAASRISAGPP
jgi:hypothetical protein